MELKDKFIPSLQINGKWSLIIGDYTYWMNNEVELENWLVQNDVTREGMVLQFDTEELRTWFVVRWS